MAATKLTTTTTPYINGERNKNKKMLEEGVKKLENFKLAISKEQLDFKQQLEYIKTGTSLLNTYRSTIQAVDDVIEKKIIPELEFVHSFLIAEAIKNNILSGDNVTKEIKSEELSLIADTDYREYFQFVVNTFCYYQLIFNFFSKSVVTDLMYSVKQGREEDIIVFEEEILAIDNETKQLEYGLKF